MRQISPRYEVMLLRFATLDWPESRGAHFNLRRAEAFFQAQRLGRHLQPNRARRGARDKVQLGQQVAAKQIGTFQPVAKPRGQPDLSSRTVRDITIRKRPSGRWRYVDKNRFRRGTPARFWRAR